MIKNDPKVVAVVVTFNRLPLLIRLVDILKSISALSQVIIVNNSSSDGTREYVKLSIPKVKCFNLESNSGSAGGFEFGVREALKYNPDFVWLMDDDGYPSLTCLDNLLGNIQSLDIANPLVLNEQNHNLLAFGLGIDIVSVDKAKQASKELIIWDMVNPFNGTLIRVEVFKRIGLIKRDMFIWGDEAEYILRAQRANLRIGTITNAFFFHPESKSKFVNFMNRFTIELKPDHLIGNLFRNQAFILRKYYGNVSAFKYFILYVLYFLSCWNVRSLVVFIRYFVDGYFNIYRLKAIR